MSIWSDSTTSGSADGRPGRLGEVVVGVLLGLGRPVPRERRVPAEPVAVALAGVRRQQPLLDRLEAGERRLLVRGREGEAAVDQDQAADQVGAACRQDGRDEARPSSGRPRRVGRRRSPRRQRHSPRHAGRSRPVPEAGWSDRGHGGRVRRPAWSSAPARKGHDRDDEVMPWIASTGAPVPDHAATRRVPPATGTSSGSGIGHRPLDLGGHDVGHLERDPVTDPVEHDLAPPPAVAGVPLQHGCAAGSPSAAAASRPRPASRVRRRARRGWPGRTSTGPRPPGPRWRAAR